MLQLKRNTLSIYFKNEEIIANKISEIKIFTLDLYYENRDKLKAFLIQIVVYVSAHSELITLKNKMLFIASYLRKDAFK